MIIASVMNCIVILILLLAILMVVLLRVMRTAASVGARAGGAARQGIFDTMAVQYKGGVQYVTNATFPRFDTKGWRAVRDRAPPLTHRRPVRVSLYCSAPRTRAWERGLFLHTVCLFQGEPLV